MPLHYTHLIVGAGSSGAALAARLSEDDSNQVILLEAGLDYRASDAPDAMLSPNPNNLILSSEYKHFRYPTLNAARTSHQSQQPYWRGRGLGGSSAINGQIAIRGLPEDYDRWSTEGCDGWAYKDVLPFFNKLETDLHFGNKAYHGDSGPIPIYRASLNQWGPIDRALGESALDLNYSWAGDHNAPDAMGVSPYAINSLDGKRVSTNDAYLEPSRGRNNLTIQGDSTIDKVIFKGLKARGVLLTTGEIFSADNIILCAGAIHSPTILLRSGIGPEDDLKNQNIDVLLNLPVGEGLQDHPMMNFIVNLKKNYLPPAEFRHTNCCVRYSSGLVGAGPGDMMIVAMNRLGDSIGNNETASHKKKIERTFGTMGVWVNECFSRGKIQLASKNPMDQPIINENMLSDERDLIRLRDGIKRITDIMLQPAMGVISESILRVGDFKSFTERHKDIDAWMLAHVGDAQHATSTCRMGAENDKRSVVNSNCQILGTESLYVIDASIMPSVPRANTHLTAVMIGEKMADYFAKKR